ncbi:hypothetical protein [Aliikangiella coralliicola]|uniref:Uncharacterized protein n=1 Tax=Aliikangiella coralliicola TaxID=2592383 RepID=A0A545UCA7_9GAMM|nr:hypothetical protein [Aliikangiella coralliicola]TQV87096.1 hypothetical protein FLL46_14925 [Aliikangiella coralliicola]
MFKKTVSLITRNHWRSLAITLAILLAFSFNSNLSDLNRDLSNANTELEHQLAQLSGNYETEKKQLKKRIQFNIDKLVEKDNEIERLNSELESPVHKQRVSLKRATGGSSNSSRYKQQSENDSLDSSRENSSWDNQPQQARQFRMLMEMTENIPMNSELTDEFEVALNDAIPQTYEGSELDLVECIAAYCRLEVIHDNTELQKAFLENTNLLPDWNSESIVKEFNDPEEFRTVVFIPVRNKVFSE